jgi:hypothetical protein
LERFYRENCRAESFLGKKDLMKKKRTQKGKKKDKICPKREVNPQPSTYKADVLLSTYRVGGYGLLNNFKITIVV